MQIPNLIREDLGLEIKQISKQLAPDTNCFYNPLNLRTPYGDFELLSILVSSHLQQFVSKESLPIVRNKQSWSRIHNSL